MLEMPGVNPQGGSRTDADYHSCEDFVVAMRSLTAPEIKRLALQGRALAVGITMNAQDLLGEAIRATADGDRRWPKDVGLGAYLFMSMMSAASNERRKEAQLIHVPIGGDANGLGDRLANLPDPAPSPETKAMFADIESRAFELLAGDELAEWLLLSRLEGEGRSVFCELHNISDKQYEAVTKRLQRKLRSLQAEA